jgi:HEAT repeat protein
MTAPAPACPPSPHPGQVVDTRRGNRVYVYRIAYGLLVVAGICLNCGCARHNGKQDHVSIEIERLDNPDPGVRLRAIKALQSARGSDGRKAVTALLPRLQDPNALVRRVAAITLGKIGHANLKAVVPALSERLRDAREILFVRRAATQALGLIGPAARASLGDITAAMKSSEARPLRFSAACALVSIDQDYDAATPVLIEGLAATNDFSDEAVVELALLGPVAVPFLSAALEHKDSAVRYQAVMALRRIGPAASASLPALQKRLDDPIPEVRQAATAALKKIKAKQEEHKR